MERRQGIKALIVKTGSCLVLLSIFLTIAGHSFAQGEIRVERGKELFPKICLLTISLNMDLITTVRKTRRFSYVNYISIVELSRLLVKSSISLSEELALKLLRIHLALDGTGKTCITLKKNRR